MEQLIHLWNRASFYVMDVRRVTVDPGKAGHSYTFPSSAYVVVIRGSGYVRLQQITHDMQAFQVFHAPKGMTFFMQTEEPVEYCLILYRAWLSLGDHYRILKAVDPVNPFSRSYSLLSPHPLDTYDKIRSMMKEWAIASPLSRFHVKTIFQQLVYEWLARLEQQALHSPQSTLVEQSIRYMHDHVQEPIALDQLASSLSCSSRYLAKLFQRQLQASPIQVLTRIRLVKAVQFLCHTDVSLQEIALQVGYVHAFTLNKVFKKHMGMSPGLYRQRWNEAKPLPKWPLAYSDSDIVQLVSALYNDNDNHGQNMANKERNMNMNQKVGLSVSTVMLCLTLILGACGGNVSSNDTGSLSTSPVQSSAAATEKATRTVATLKGDIEIPAKPERIVGVPIEYRELLHALGVTPVAAQNNNTEFPAYLGDDFRDVLKLGGGANMPFEAILSAEPDLILASSWAAAESYDGLSQIAPTVVLEDTDWRTTLPLMAEVLEMQETAEQVLADYDEAVADAKRRLQDRIGTATVMMLQVNGKEYRIIGLKNGRAQLLYQELGLQPPATADLQNESQLVVSLEKIPEYNPDYILVQLFDEEAESRAAFDDLMNHPVFQNMDAFKNNRVFPIGQENGGKEWHLFSFSPQANLYGIQKIVEIFESHS